MVKSRRCAVVEAASAPKYVGVVQGETFAPPEARRRATGAIAQRVVPIRMDGDEVPRMEKFVRDLGQRGTRVRRECGARHPDSDRGPMLERVFRAILNEKMEVGRGSATKDIHRLADEASELVHERERIERDRGWQRPVIDVERGTAVVERPVADVAEEERRVEECGGVGSGEAVGASG